VYYYNGAQWYEQFLQVGRLYQALILLGLALLSFACLCIFLILLGLALLSFACLCIFGLCGAVYNKLFSVKFFSLPVSELSP